MAVKKKQLKLNETPLEPVAVIPLVQEPVAFPQGTCIQCRFLETGTWFGPRCGNPASPEYKTHRADSGSCAEFAPKQFQPIPAPTDGDGLYDPEPAAKDPGDDLAALLDRETESQEASDNAI